MIIPARWYAGGKGLDEFRESMLSDNHIRILVDFPNSSECFPGVQIKGGVCYFLWDRENPGDCLVKTILNNAPVSEMFRPLREDGADTFIRWNEAIRILKKVQALGEDSFETIVSSRKPFGFSTDFDDFSKEYHPEAVKIYANKAVGYIKRSQIHRNREWISKYKIYISKAYGAGEEYPHQIINILKLGEPNSCCTETYLVVGPFDSRKIAENAISYMRTKFFRFLVMLNKPTQDATRKVYHFVPMQDFSEPWTDKKLYKKYGLTQEEIAFIESMVRPMDNGEETETEINEDNGDE
jgi:site-specific DNA-methyltransferase (adenine-specific)